MSEDVNVSESKAYEIAYVLAGEDGEKTVRDMLANFKCELLHAGNLFALKLAYPLKKHASGFFGYAVFKAAPESVKGLKDALVLAPGVLRSLIITPPVKVAVRGERPVRGVVRAAATVGAEAPAAPATPAPEALSNEGLEKKLEEILK